MNRYTFILPLAIAVIIPSHISAQNATQRVEIPPLIQTEWGQQAPFFYKTPIINGEHAKTGCVATAMSQVIYFHQYPEKGKNGTFSFDNFTFDFANTTFDYSLMKEKYEKSDPATDPSVEAVATLMYACGVTVNMDYGVESSSGNFSMISGALNEWFLYPIDGMGMVQRDYFTLEEWEEIIYEELSAGRPVLYMGGNGESSHVFVCDGYKDGKFHMNLGWYGEKNAYLPLSNLITERVGKPGLWSMNSSQKIIRGVRNPGESDPGPLATASSFIYDPATDSFTLKSISCYVNNTSIISGIRLVKNDGSKEYLFWSESDATLNRSNSTITFTADLSEVEDGNYTIRPVYKLDSQEEVYPVYCNILNTRYYTADIASNSISNPKEGSDIEVNVSVSEYTPNSTYIKGEKYGYSFTVFAENNGNTTITRFGIKFCKPGTTEELYSTNYRESLAPGECKTVSLAIPNMATPGEYDMIIYDYSSKQPFGDPIRVIYHDAKEIVTVEGSSYRYMPLSEESDEAVILMPLSTAYSLEVDGETEIPSSVNIDGKEYKIAEIGPRLLYERSDITSLTIPSTVKKIGASAFSGCSNISSIKVEAVTPPEIHYSAFDADVVSKAKISVPEESVDLYKEAPVWDGFSYDVETEGSNSLTMETFSIVPGLSATTSMTLETNQTFYGCQFDMTLPEGLQLTADGVKVSDNPEVKNFIASCSSVKDENTYTVLMYSLDNTPYPTGKTPILNLSFVSDEEFKGGSIVLSKVILSKEEGEVFQDFNLEPSTCAVVADFSTSISDLEDIESTLVDVYNVSGVVIGSNVMFDEIKNSLTPGLYIIRRGNQSQKVMVR